MQLALSVVASELQSTFFSLIIHQLLFIIDHSPALSVQTDLVLMFYSDGIPGHSTTSKDEFHSTGSHC